MTVAWTPDEQEKHCPNCQRSLQPVALFNDVWGCATCKETWYLPQPSDLQETAEQAQQHVAGGRSWPSLKESKVFDSEKLSTSPLFERRLF